MIRTTGVMRQQDFQFPVSDFRSRGSKNLTMAKMGRPGYKDELKTKEIIDLSIRVIKRALQDEELPLQFKAEIASRFVLKAIPSADNAPVQIFSVSVQHELSELETRDLKRIIDLSRERTISEGATGISEVRQIENKDQER